MRRLCRSAGIEPGIAGAQPEQFLREVALLPRSVLRGLVGTGRWFRPRTLARRFRDYCCRSMAARTVRPFSARRRSRANTTMPRICRASISSAARCALPAPGLDGSASGSRMRHRSMPVRFRPTTICPVSRRRTPCRCCRPRGRRASGWVMPPTSPRITTRWTIWPVWWRADGASRFMRRAIGSPLCRADRQHHGGPAGEPGGVIAGR